MILKKKQPPNKTNYDVFLDFFAFFTGAIQILDLILNFIQADNDSISLQNQEIIKQNLDIENKLDNETNILIKEVLKEIQELKQTKED